MTGRRTKSTGKAIAHNVVKERDDEVEEEQDHEKRRGKGESFIQHLPNWPGNDGHSTH